MKGYLFIPSALLLLVLTYFPREGNSEAVQVNEASVPEAQNRLIKVTDKGIEPLNLVMKRDDSIAFFLNDTKDSLITVELDFKEHSIHCGGGNLQAAEAGKVRSVKPIGPKDFASTCFHDSGKYSYVIYGLGGNNSGVRGSITVE